LTVYTNTPGHGSDLPQTFRQAPDSRGVAQAVQSLLNADKPLVVAGAGVIRSEAWPELKAFVEMLSCPVATSISGKGAIAEDHPYALGVIGSNGGLSYRHPLINDADLIFYIGCACGSVDFTMADHTKIAEAINITSRRVERTRKIWATP
jgi:acetolactate synthase-1/2/3 large subunit